MALSAEDQRLVASMREREHNLKQRQRAVSAVRHRSRLYRRALAGVAALIVAGAATGIFIGAASLAHLVNYWRLTGLVAAGGLVIGALLAWLLLRTRRGRRLLARKDQRLREKYSPGLQAGRLWEQFWYEGADIAPHVQQILYALDSEGRFDSVREALDSARRNHHEDSDAAELALRQFNAVAEQASLVVVSSVNASGRPSSRVLPYARTGRPGVWHVTIAPHSAEVSEFDEGNVAVLTVPTEDGAAIRSDDVRIRRAAADRQLEISYELTLCSARVETWTGYDLVSFPEPDGPDVPGPRPAPGQAARKGPLPGP